MTDYLGFKKIATFNGDRFFKEKKELVITCYDNNGEMVIERFKVNFNKITFASREGMLITNFQNDGEIFPNKLPVCVYTN